MTRNDSRLRVLVVEDELLIRWAIRETLTDAGHSVVEAENAESAVRALANSVEPIDVVVLDYRLPDSTDLALLAAIRRLSPRTAVVLMTAYGTADVAKRALDLGAHQIMNKPFDLRDLEPSLLRAARSM
jgi:DNA-binding NtrC family response regulator